MNKLNENKWMRKMNEKWKKNWMTTFKKMNESKYRRKKWMIKYETDKCKKMK